MPVNGRCDLIRRLNAKQGSRAESWSLRSVRIQWNILGQTAKLWRSSNISGIWLRPHVQDVDGTFLIFGSTKPTATPWKTGDSINAWNLITPSHLDAAVCPRKFHWTVQGHLHIRRHDLGNYGRIYVSLHIPAGYNSVTIWVERINNRRTMQRLHESVLSCCACGTMASRATFIFWRQYSETFLLQIGAADI